MISVLASKERGFFDHGWLKTHHSFSFGEYYNPKQMRHRVLRVINEDVIAGGTGFGQHGHNDMEIITYVISGTLEHRDSLGNLGTIQAGEIQRMSAGSGIEHAEANPDKSVPCHLLQIWLIPSVKGIPPSWEQVEWKTQPLQSNGLRLLASPDQRFGSAKIHQDALLWHGDLAVGQAIHIEVFGARGGWFQLVDGNVTVNKTTSLQAGDGIKIDGPELLNIHCNKTCKFIWFDLP